MAFPDVLRLREKISLKVCVCLISWHIVTEQYAVSYAVGDPETPKLAKL